MTKLDDTQFDRLLQAFQRRSSWIDTAAKVVPIVTVLVLGVWTLHEYRSFTRENQRLTNEQLSSGLLKTEVERKKLENEAVIQQLEIDLARKRRLMVEAKLSAKLIQTGTTQNLYQVDYTMYLKNESKQTAVMTYNMFAPFVGRLVTTNIGDFCQIKAPESFTQRPADGDAVKWERQYLLFNILKDAETNYLEQIKTKYAPDEVGRAGTGEIEPGEDMEISFTYYTRARPHDWFAVMAHARVNDSEEAGDNWTHTEWITLQEQDEPNKAIEVTLDSAPHG